MMSKYHAIKKQACLKISIGQTAVISNSYQVCPNRNNPSGAVKFRVNHVTVLTPPFDVFDKGMVVEFAIAAGRDWYRKSIKRTKKSRGRDREPGPQLYMPAGKSLPAGVQ